MSALVAQMSRTSIGVLWRTLCTAQPTDLSLLDGGEQLGLHRQREVTYLVEKQRTACGYFHTSCLGLAGIGKGAFLVAKQLAFEQLFGDTTQVDGDERLSRAR